MSLQTRHKSSVPISRLEMRYFPFTRATYLGGLEFKSQTRPAILSVVCHVFLRRSKYS